MYCSWRVRPPRIFGLSNVRPTEASKQSNDVCQKTLDFGDSTRISLLWGFIQAGLPNNSSYQTTSQQLIRIGEERIDGQPTTVEELQGRLAKIDSAGLPRANGDEIASVRVYLITSNA